MSPIKKSAPPLCLYSVGRGGAAVGAATFNPHSSSNPLLETMRRSTSAMLLITFLSVFLCASFSLYCSRNPISISEVLYSGDSLAAISDNADSANIFPQERLNHPSRRVYSIQDSDLVTSVSVLLPDWQVLVIVSPYTEDSQMLSNQKLTCLYPSKSTAPARFAGFLPSLNRTMFKCFLPKGARRPYPLRSPMLKRLSEEEQSSVYWPSSVQPQELLRWNFLVYESFSTDDDVVLFAKGLNNRQGINRSPSELKCVFVNEKNNNTVMTAVTSSAQEVFRCNPPDLTAFGSGYSESIILKVSLQILAGKKVVPSVAYYTPKRKLAKLQPKSQICAANMVYNVAKFLKEWVTYHSKIGVEKFILYDNDSDDELIPVIKDLNQQGYNVETVLWVWPKTQESGFSHSALYANDSCNWMMYIDVDEFVFSPSWENSSRPSNQMLKSFLSPSEPESESDMIGEVSIMCNEFGPSNQKSHPEEGVTQGYNCRRKMENRHKSVVLLQAIEHSLVNVIHHFRIKEGYKWKQIGLEEAIVNHYKYQAWSEFKAKFRRRVSAYVVDWMQVLNPQSKDRTPGLGFEAVEPEGWESKFCEVRDDRLKLVLQKWFGSKTETGYTMVWQS